jgi:protein TonB
VLRNDAPAAAAPAAAAAASVPAESTVATVEVETAVTEKTEASATSMVIAAAAPAPAALELASVVEPVTPRSMIGKLRGEVQVHVAFTVNADGSVADAAVRKSSHPQMDAAVLEAVRQWRYQPIAAPRTHEVQLVLRQGD